MTSSPISSGVAPLLSALQMTLELLRAIESNETCTGDEAAVALEQFGPLPDVAEENLAGRSISLGTAARTLSLSADS